LLEKKNLHNLSHLNCGPASPKFARFEFTWLQRVENTARESVQNTHHWSWRNKTANENGGPRWMTSSLWQPFVNGVVDRSRSMMRVL